MSAPGLRLGQFRRGFARAAGLGLLREPGQLRFRAREDEVSGTERRPRGRVLLRRPGARMPDRVPPGDSLEPGRPGLEPGGPGLEPGGPGLEPGGPGLEPGGPGLEPGGPSPEPPRRGPRWRELLRLGWLRLVGLRRWGLRLAGLRRVRSLIRRAARHASGPIRSRNALPSRPVTRRRAVVASAAAGSLLRARSEALRLPRRLAGAQFRRVLLPPPAGGDAERAPRSAAARRAARQAARQARTSPARRRAPWPAVAAAGLGWLGSGIVLYSCYLHLSRTVPGGSDGAANILQAWSMLHGNPLLRGWVLSDVSFYTTELPQYMLIELARGMSPDVAHIASAMTYTFLVLLAARLAKGSATGPQGLVRAGIAGGIMLAPPQSSASVLLLQPDHVGSAVPVLLMLLLIDRAGRRWYVPLLVFALVAWALVADQVILITAAVPLIVVGLARAYHLVIRLRRGVRSAGFEIALVAAAVAGVAGGDRALALIRSSGGFTVYPVSDQLAPFAELPHNALEVLQGVLVLFGADFPGRTVGFLAAVGLVHLVGAGLVVWALCAAFRRFSRSTITVQLLAAGVTMSVIAYLLGPNAESGATSREFAAVLPLGAALAGRLLARRLRRSRLVPAMAAVLVVYAAGLVTYVGRPPVPAQNQALASWLAAHKLDYGLADYWLANSVTVDSRGKVELRAITAGKYESSPHLWETMPSWYSAKTQVANFVVMPSYGPGPWTSAPSAATMVHAFGQPARVYLLADYTVLVWNTNLLADLV